MAEKVFREEDLVVGQSYSLTGERARVKESMYKGKNDEDHHEFAYDFRGMPLLWETESIDFTEDGKVCIPEDAKVGRDFATDEQNGLEATI